MRLSHFQSPLRTLVFTALLYLLAPSSAHAQSPYLFASVPISPSASQVVAFSVNPDGTLTEVGSPFPVAEEGGPVTTDPTDQYLFILNPTSNTISVMSIGTNGALTSVGSPVAAPTGVPGGGGLNPSGPFAMATYKGTSTPTNYLFVAYRNTTSAVGGFNGAVVAYQIGTTGAPLIPTVQTNLQSPPVVTSPVVVSRPGYLYAVESASGVFSGVAVFAIDPDSGALNQVSSQGGINLGESSLAINPEGTLLFDGWGGAAGGIEPSVILPNGSLSPSIPSNVVPLSGSSVPPSAMLVDGSGQILYVQQGGQAAAYLVDSSTGALTPTSTQLPFSVAPGSVLANPVEPYLYVQRSTEIHVYGIDDFTTGAVIERKGSPYPIPVASRGIAITHNASAQVPQQHAAELDPPLVNFNDTTVGSSSSPTSLTLDNTGTEPLNIVSIAATGADGTSFSIVSGCPSQVAPRKSCSIAVTFTPMQTGVLQGALTISDDAGISTQSVQLTGNGVSSSSGSGGGSSGGAGGSGGTGGGSGGSGGGSGSGGSGGTGSGGGSGSGGSGDPPPQPTVLIAPAALNFSSPAQGTASQLNVTLTNSNDAPNALPLVISSLQIAGLNANDFTIAAACNEPSYVSGQSCVVGIVFVPGAPGNRVATLVVTDNAANSPQSIALSGTTASQMLTIAPGSTDGYSESVPAGQTATFLLKVTPTFTGMVSFTPCSGAPTSATCTVLPSPMPVVANETQSLTVTVTTTTASASAIPFTNPNASSINRFRIGQVYGILCSALLLLLLRRGEGLSRPFSNAASANCAATAGAPIPAGVAAITILAMTILAIAGCGGASTVATAPAVTPTSQSQTYTITITPTAVTSTNIPIPAIQPIQLTLILD